MTIITDSYELCTELRKSRKVIDMDYRFNWKYFGFYYHVTITL
jgi:hypothetical protein